MALIGVHLGGGVMSPSSQGSLKLGNHKWCWILASALPAVLYIQDSFTPKCISLD